MRIRYPGSLAWQLFAPKRVVRKTEPFRKFQRFLVGETEVVSSKILDGRKLTGKGQFESTGSRVHDPTASAGRTATSHSELPVPGGVELTRPVFGHVCCAWV